MRKINVVSILVCLIGHASASENALSADKPNPDPVRLNWTDVDKLERVEVMQLLAAQTKSNFEKIATWKGVYDFKQYIYIPEVEVRQGYLSNIPPGKKPVALRQETEGSVALVVDLGRGSIYRDKTCSKMVFYKDGTDEKFDLINFIPPEWRSVSTVEKYIKFDPKRPISASIHLPDHPEGQGKRAAFVYAAEAAEAAGHTDQVDPRALYKFDPGNTFWGSQELIVKALTDQLDKTQKKEADLRVTISRAKDSNGEIWYRYRMRVDGLNKSSLWHTVYWDSNSGFNPVKSEVTHDKPDGPPDNGTEWQWKKVDGIYVPEHVVESVFHSKDHKISFRRESTLKNVILNEAIDKDQFDYAGLGLKDGEIVIDDVNRTVSKMKDGRTIKLGNYGDKYFAESHAGNSSKWILIVSNVIFFGLLIVFRKKIKRGDRNAET